MTSGYDEDGLMTWQQANDWATQLVYGDYDNWRLPTTLQPDLSCQYQSSDNTFSYGSYCTGADMGHLFYIDLSGESGQTISSIGDLDLLKFQNLNDDFYWTDTEVSHFTTYAWYFGFNAGTQGSLSKDREMYAWAVADGDVFISSVPIPTAIWLFISGITLMFTLSKYKKIV